MYKVELETSKKELEMKNIEKNGYGSGEITSLYFYFKFSKRGILFFVFKKC